jgi:16S rRNA (guanine966-N2)-methyltransferase
MSNPRIISGKLKGIRLDSIPGKITRPITDRVKEALFNIIGADIQNAAFLDLFAGTGSVGLEALSRGANFAQFIEINLKAIKILRKNTEKCNLGDNAEILNGDAFQYIQSKPNTLFDYVFIAPPQYHDLWAKMLQEINRNIHLLNTNAWIIAQIDPIEYKDIDLDKLKEFDQRKYGDTLLVFYFFEDSI